jgi:predicted Zn-ribbon and HTH transcriptional regulator
MTVREALLRHLREGPRTAHELSGLVGIPEKQVADHLAHVARSLRRTPERLRVEPAQCLDCGFVFRERARFDRPSACPVCRGQHLEPPRFAVKPA